eukprot:3775965-Prorocentrum_lima.AAC.1
MVQGLEGQVDFLTQRVADLEAELRGVGARSSGTAPPLEQRGEEQQRSPPAGLGNPLFEMSPR